MQIIQKPKQHKLPFRLKPRIVSQSSQSSLPNVYLQSRSHKKAAKSSHSRDITISYSDGQKKSQIRTLLRKALSAHMNFQLSEEGIFKFQAEQIIKTIKHPVKVIPYQSQKYEKLYQIVKQIFGQDIQLSPKDLIAAYGSITQSFYIFFTSPYYKPNSFCCKEAVYIRIQNNQAMPTNRYAKMDTSMEFFAKVQNVASKFICFKCKQPVLIIQKKSKKNVSESRTVGKEAIHFEAERQKISMSIIVASGRFKNLRIDDLNHKQISANLGEDKNYLNPQQLFPIKRNNRTLVLRSLNNKNN